MVAINKNPSVAVIGLGYVGLSTAVVLASRGLNVLGVDVNARIVEAVNAGHPHIAEPELGGLLREVVAEGRLRAVNVPDRADIFVIAVPTPFIGNHMPDVSYIQRAADSIATVLRSGNLVILESTSPVGTSEKLSRWLAEKRPELSFPHEVGEAADTQIAYCPERVLPGKILEELVNNDRIIGGMTAKATDMAADFYSIFVKGDIAKTRAQTAEMCKLAENSFRDVSIAFANELSIICHERGIDALELISLANRHPRVNILRPGCGVGGHCIAVDPWFIVSQSHGRAQLIKTAREINDSKPLWVLERIEEAIQTVLEEETDKKSVADVTVACLGLTFKPDIDDLRESPALRIANALSDRGARTLAAEPNINTLPPTASMGLTLVQNVRQAIDLADIVCVLVGHSAFIPYKDALRRRGRVLDFVGFLREARS